MHLTAQNESGNLVEIDGSGAIGGQEMGARPMELLLMGLGGCSSMDVISILNKQKIDDFDYQVEIEASRVESIPKIFKDIHVKFLFEGEIDPKKLTRAVDLSMDKYCSVTKIMEASASISHEVFLNGNKL